MTFLQIDTGSFPNEPPYAQFQFIKAVYDFYAVAGDQLLDELKAAAPQGTGPTAGNLKNSIHYTAGNATSDTTGGTVYALNFVSDDPAAAFVIGGTTAHRIDPVSALALHWLEEGADVFFNHVNHPGTRANPFPDVVAEGAQDWLLALFQQRVLENLTGGLSGA